MKRFSPAHLDVLHGVKLTLSLGEAALKSNLGLDGRVQDVLSKTLVYGLNEHFADHALSATAQMSRVESQATIQQAIQGMVHGKLNLKKEPGLLLNAPEHADAVMSVDELADKVTNTVLQVGIDELTDQVTNALTTTVNALANSSG
ncbi:hypothetical protein H0H92_000967 [Tricholoma furcatifolium]|nr:hypothetical protein H0H92_000967 [Tricholoma furcatifolium]